MEVLRHHQTSLEDSFLRSETPWNGLSTKNRKRASAALAWAGGKNLSLTLFVIIPFLPYLS